MNTTPSVTTILILAAEPSNQARIRVGNEMSKIQECLRQARVRERYRVITQTATKVDDLQRALLEERPTIIHFCGHGGGPSGLQLEDEQGLAQSVPNAALAGLFK